MAKTSIEKMYNLIFDMSASLKEVLEGAQELVSIAHEYGGIISKVVEEQLINYLVPSVKGFIGDTEVPGSLKGLVEFLDSVPLKQTRLTPGEYDVETIDDFISSDSPFTVDTDSDVLTEEPSQTSEEVSEEAPTSATDAISETDIVYPAASSEEAPQEIEDLPQNMSFNKPEGEVPAVETPVQEEETVLPESTKIKGSRLVEAEEEEDSNIRWTVVRTHDFGSSYGNELKDNVVGEFKTEEEAFEMRDRLNDLLTPEEVDLLGTAYVVEKITVISADHEPETDEELSEPLPEVEEITE